MKIFSGSDLGLKKRQKKNFEANSLFYGSSFSWRGGWTIFLGGGAVEMLRKGGSQMALAGEHEEKNMCLPLGKKTE